MTESEFKLNQPKPLLIVLSGPSGVGKDTVLQRMKDRQTSFFFVVTMTDRPPRTGEQEGVDYFFVTTQYFKNLIEADGFIEHAFVYGDNKGVPREQVRQAMLSGKDVVMRVDVQGAAHIRKLFPDAVLIFLATDSMEELIERLVSRKTDTAENIQIRIATALEEMQRINEFDYVVANRDNQQDESVDAILAIVRAEHCRVDHRQVSL